MFYAVKLSLTSAAKLRQAEAAMNICGPKKKRKKLQTTADIDLACSQQKVNPQAGTELCVVSLQGIYFDRIHIVMIFDDNWTEHFVIDFLPLLCIIVYLFVLDSDE